MQKYKKNIQFLFLLLSMPNSIFFLNLQNKIYYFNTKVKMKKKTLILFLSLSLVSCFKSKDKSKITAAPWLPGKWENRSTDGDLLETWTKINDSIYSGESYFIKGKDTLHSEKIQLVQKGENLVYISNIKGQNDNKPVTFTQDIKIEKQLVFENSKNDYPKKVSYNPISKNGLIIEISGTQQGKQSFDTYTLKKTK